jgi:hypothetical protein
MKSLRMFGLLAIMMVAFGINATAQVDVSTGGPVTTYANIKLAFDAVNAGTHTGAITVDITGVGTYTDPASPAVLNSSGAGLASYTSVLVRPTADGVLVRATTLGGRGVIELNGADNVTIDGDNPLTIGTNRNLTIQHTAAATTTLTSTVRIATGTGVGTFDSANNNTVKNLLLTGSAVGRNAAANTSTTGSENTVFGVYAGGNGGTAPTALTSVTTNTAVTGTTINNLTIDNNQIISVARGVVFNGAVTTVSTGVTISNNLIGDQGTVSGTPPYTTPASTVYTKGVWVAGTTAVAITGNSIKNILSFVGTTMAGLELNTAIGAGAITLNNNTVSAVVNNGTLSAARGFDIASTSTALFTASGNTISNIQSVGSLTTTGFRFSTTATAGTIEKNMISGVNSRGTGTFGAFGLSIEAGNNITIKNNFISDVQHNMTGGGAFSTGFGVFGLRLAAGTGHKVYNNSVNLASAYLGTPAASLLSAAFAILGTGQTGIDVRNNIFANTITGGTTSIAHVSVYLPSGGTSAMALTMNNNDYYFGTDVARQGAGQAGTTAGTNFFPTFNPALTTPATNLRSYTNTLNTSANDDFSISADPQFVSSTDLHISGSSPALNVGATIATVTDDIDGNARPIDAAYEIGADERIAVVAPGEFKFSSATYAGNEGTTATITVQRVNGSSGAVTVNYATSDGTATAGTCGTNDYVAATGTLSWLAGETTAKTFTVMLCNDGVYDPETVNLALSSPTGGATLTTPNTAVLSINDVPSVPFSGSYNVGGPGNYPSLTNAGGIFEAINAVGASGPVTLNITTDMTGETGANPINPIVGNPAILIKPSGAPRTISGIAPIAVIRINGADNIRIDGSTAASVVGGTPALRELTVQNLSTSTSSGVIHIGSATESSNGNTVRNVIAIGNDPLQTVSGISTGGATPTSAALFANNNTRIENCNIQKVQQGIFTRGVSQAVLNTGTVILENDLSATGVNRVRTFGIAVGNEDGILISQNSIGGMDTTGTGTDTFGIAAGTTGVSDSTTTTTIGVTNAVIARNKVNGVSQDATFSATGIAVAGIAGTNTIANNMVTGVISDGDGGDSAFGIFVTGVTGTTTRLYYNSVAMTGDRGLLLTPSTAMNPSFALAISGTDPIVELKNNIFFTTQTATGGGADAKSYGIGTNAVTFVNLDSNFNAFFSTGANAGGFRSGSLDRAVDSATEVDFATLALWSAAVTDDVNSVEGNPLFVSPLNNLHILASTLLLIDKGTSVSVLDDFDGHLRSGGFVGGIPDIGADEILAPTAASASVRGRVLTPTGRGLLNATVVLTNTNTGEVSYARTTNLGYFNFKELPTGNFYVINVNSKRYLFKSQSFTLSEDLTDLVLTGQ